MYTVGALLNQDIRWIQRFSNYKKALKQLKDAVKLSKKRELSQLEKQGLIQGFEYTHELSWKCLKDFLEYRGQTEQIFGSKDATRIAFNTNLISHGDEWMSMIKSRNLSSHTYNEDTVEKIIELIVNIYIDRFLELEKKLLILQKDEK
jgi:nucleotidyltransferase substrate binding protein (TIGR01987 family)